MVIEPSAIDPVELLRIALAVHMIAAVVAAMRYLRQRYEHDVNGSESYENLAHAVALGLPWVHTLSRCRSSEEVDKVHPPIEIRMAAVITSIYLPALTKRAVRLTNSLILYRAHLLNCCSDDRLSDRIDTSVPIVESVSRLHPELVEMQKEFLDCRLALEDAIANKTKPESHPIVKFAMFDIGAALRRLPLLSVRHLAKLYRPT